MKQKGVSIIISTYNWPHALQLSLNSLLKQTILPSEIIIADDGSTDETKKVVLDFSKKTSIPVIHCWQEDKGFRLSLIRNKALANCNYEYVIQIDGDIICHQKFIEDHLYYSEKGYFLCGRRCKLEIEDTTKSIETNTLVLTSKSLNSNKLHYKKRISLIFKILKSNLINPLIKTGVQGCNMSFWLEDVTAINGYNNDFEGWGKEDDELVLRLNRYGLKRRTLKFGAIAYHLMHEARDLKNLNINEALLEKIEKNETVKTTKGIANLK